MAKKITKYTEPIMVRLDKATMANLQVECVKVDINEAVYCRRAVEKCLKTHCIKNSK